MLSALNVSLSAPGAPSRRPPTAEGKLANVGDQRHATDGDGSLLAHYPDEADDDSGTEVAAAPKAARAAGAVGMTLVPHADIPSDHEFAEYLQARRAYESSTLMMARFNRRDVGLVLDGRV